MVNVQPPWLLSEGYNWSGYNASWTTWTTWRMSTRIDVSVQLIASPSLNRSGSVSLRRVSGSLVVRAYR
ncbi:hypothetical protein VN97_g8479 [Penicillium thymicola]|uniref:Uncharacterized protein n=1 Tax=Penicillium thymicola TaxID=293382 RepID=A0AAI9X5R0_PENTH|nr:hypothetical protein VN97_g8479 [Penicillium thymicola]